MTEKTKKAPNAWQKHVAEFRKTHPELKFSEVLSEAKKSYQKVKK